MKQIKTCQECKKEFEFDTRQKYGLFCCTKCYANNRIAKRLRLGTTMDKFLRKYIYEHWEPKCCECGNGIVWNNKPLRLQIDHKNGNKKDNRRENIRIICPNCHTQTETWGVKNASEDGMIAMVNGAKYLRSLKKSNLHMT